MVSFVLFSGMLLCYTGIEVFLFDYLNAIWQYPSNNQPSYVWNASYPAISWANEYRVIAQAKLNHR